MKIEADFDKATPHRPGADVLRAIAQAAQAATPTARASIAATPEAHGDALVRLFSPAPADTGPVALGSFNPAAERSGGRQER